MTEFHSVKLLLNGNRDLAMDGRIRAYIGQYVDVLRIAPSGLIAIKTDDGSIFHVAKYNLG